MGEEHVRVSDLVAGDRVLLDGRVGAWVVVTLDGDPQFIMNVALRHEVIQQTTTLHLLADQVIERVL